MNHQSKVLAILKNLYELNTKILRSQNTKSFDEQSFVELYEAYSLSNHKLKNAIELLQIITSKELADL